MTNGQIKEIERFHAKIDDQGNTLIHGSMLWLILEAIDNVDRLQNAIDSKDRAPKKVLKAILKDTRDQLRELIRRLD